MGKKEDISEFGFLDGGWVQNSKGECKKKEMVKTYWERRREKEQQERREKEEVEKKEKVYKKKLKEKYDFRHRSAVE